MNKKQQIAVEMAKEIIDNPKWSPTEKQDMLFGLQKLAIPLEAYTQELADMWRNLYKEAEK